MTKIYKTTIIIPQDIEIKAASLYEKTTIDLFGRLQEWRSLSTHIKNEWRLKVLIEEHTQILKRSRYK